MRLVNGGRIIHLRGKGAVAVVDEDGDGNIVTICRHHIGLAVAVQVPDGDTEGTGTADCIMNCSRECTTPVIDEDSNSGAGTIRYCHVQFAVAVQVAEGDGGIGTTGPVIHLRRKRPSSREVQFPALDGADVGEIAHGGEALGVQDAVGTARAEAAGGVDVSVEAAVAGEGGESGGGGGEDERAVGDKPVRSRDTVDVEEVCGG